MSGYRKIIMSDGTIHHTLDGLLHNDNGPAVISPEGREEWYQYGVLHRDNGPALIDPEEEREQWYQDGMLHRIDGPAHTDSLCQLYYRHDKLHREDGPAEICEGYEAYWLNDVKWKEGAVAAEVKKRSLELFNEIVSKGLPLQRELQAKKPKFQMAKKSA